MVVISIQNNLIENNIEIKFNILEDSIEEFNLKLNVEDERFNYDKFINLYESFLDFNELFNSNLNFKYSLNTNLDLYNIESNILNLNLNKYHYYNIINFNILDNENIRLINSNILNIFDKNYSKLLNLVDLDKDYVLEKEKSFINLNKILNLNLLTSLNILLEYEITDLTSNLYRYIDLYNWNIISINRPIIGVELLNTDLSNILLSNINENNNGNFQINSDNIDIISNLIKNETTSNNYFIKIKKNIFSLNEFYIKPEINYIYNYPINFIKNEYSYNINFYINDITISDYNNNNHSLNINIKDSRLNLLSNSLVNEEITIIFYETIYNINNNINRLLNYNTNINYDINIIGYSDISLDNEKKLNFENINYIENFILNLNLTYRFNDDYLSTYNDEYNNIIKLNIIDLRIVYIFNSYIENNNFIIIHKDNIDIDFLNILNNYLELLFPSDIFENIELNTLVNNEKNIEIDGYIYTIYNEITGNKIAIYPDQYSGIWNDRITINLSYYNDELSLNNSYNFIFKDIRFDLLNDFLKDKNKTIINLINNENKYYLTDVFDIIEQFGLIYYEINPIPIIYNLNSEKEYKLLKSDNYYFEFNSNIFYEKEFELNINILLCNINCNFDLNFKFNDIKYDILLDTIFNIRFTTYIINDNFSYNLNNLSDSLLGFDFNFILNQNDYIKIENNILNLCNISTYSIYSNLIDLNVSIEDKDNDFKLIIYDLRYTLLLNLNLNLNKSIINIYDDFNFNNLNLNKNQIIYNNIEENTFYYVIIENSNIEFNNKYLYKHEIELNYIINFDYIDIDLNNNIYLIELNIIDKRYNLVFENLVFNSNINITNEKDIINLFDIFSNLNNELNIPNNLISFSNILPISHFYDITESNIEFNNNYEYIHNITLDIIIDNYDNNSNINLYIIDKRYNLLRQKIENYLNVNNSIVINNDNYENYNIKEKINQLNLLSNNIILDNINIEYEISDNYTIKEDKIEFIKNKNISNINIKIKFDNNENFENISFINIDIINEILLLSDISILINNNNITCNIYLYNINIYNYNYYNIELIYDYSNINISFIDNDIIKFDFTGVYIYDYFNFDLTFKYESESESDEIFILTLSFNDKRYDLLLNEIESNLNNLIYITDISNISTIYLNNINKKGNIINFSTNSEYFIFNNEILNLKENYLNTYINKEFTFNINLSILEYSNIKILRGYDLRYDILLNEIKNSEIINLDIEISSSLENDLEELNIYFNNNLILKGHNIDCNILKIDENNDGLDDYNKINDKFISNIDNNKIYYYLPINVLYYCDYYEIKVNYYLIIEFINEITISLDDTYNIISSD